MPTKYRVRYRQGQKAWQHLLVHKNHLPVHQPIVLDQLQVDSVHVLEIHLVLQVVQVVEVVVHLGQTQEVHLEVLVVVLAQEVLAHHVDVNHYEISIIRKG
jgi:hypothetical protein